MAGRDAEIKCGICLNAFKDPRILPCFHTVCLSCLENIADKTDQDGKFRCPICRTYIDIPDGGVRSFQTNFYIQTEGNHDFELECDACGERKSACQQCRQCNQNFCRSCSAIHVRMASSRDHYLVQILPVEKRQAKLDRLTSLCRHHPSEEVTTVCKDCDELICHVCMTSSHHDHVNTTISAEAEEKRKQLRDLIDISENNLTEIEKDMRVVKRQAESKHTFFKEQISDLRKQIDSLMSNINKKYMSFEDKIRQLNDEQLMMSNEMNENQKLTTASFKQTIDSAKQSAARKEDINLVRNFETLVQKLQRIEVSLAPAVSGHKLMENVEQCTTWIIKLNEQNGDIL